jgi:hypothetical protein
MFQLKVKLTINYNLSQVLWAQLQVTLEALNFLRLI